MKIPRFFQDNDFVIGQTFDLSAINHRHVVQVLRSKADESLVLFNGRGGEYLVTLEILSKRKSRVLIKSFDTINRESPLNTTLALAMIKPDKMDFAIQKAVELGVTAIQPLYTKRSIIKIKENRLEKKLQHWSGVIISACEQSGRTSIPILKEPKTIDQYLSSPSNDPRLAMLPGPHPKLASLEDLDKTCQGISLLIGPEGGFTPDEEDLMRQSGLKAVSFGSRILRAETAAIAGLTACQQRWGDL